MLKCDSCVKLCQVFSLYSAVAMDLIGALKSQGKNPEARRDWHSSNRRLSCVLRRKIVDVERGPSEGNDAIRDTLLPENNVHTFTR